MRISAWGVTKKGGKLRPITYRKKIAEGDVLIEVKYCSFSKADIFFIDNMWNDTKFPYVPGSEIFGVVVEKGKLVKNVEIGDYVGVGYQVFACLSCDYCKQGKEQFCKKQGLLGVHEYGGLANNIIVNSNFIYQISTKLRKPEFVSLMCYGLTAYSAIKNADLKKISNIGIVGLGNMGHLAVQIADKMGYRVTAFSHSKSKTPILKKLGIKYIINPNNGDLLEKNSEEYDFILVTTYYSHDWTKFVKLLKPEGSLCFIGLPEENISIPPTILADYARRKISGSYIGSRKEMHEILELSEKNDIKAITSVFSLKEIDKVVELFESNKIPFNVVIKID